MRRLVICLLLLTSAAACGLVVESDTGDLTTRAPAEDPGFGHVGLRGATSAVYLGSGWVITAHHSGAGEVVLGGRSYRALPESAIRLGDSGALPLPDLLVFRVDPRPHLSNLRIASTPPVVGESVVLVGAGRERGEPTLWRSQPGWVWGPHASLRWGTNRVATADIDVGSGDTVTRAFALRFDPGDTRFEAQGAIGDSGGAVFVRRAGHFELAGVMIAIAGFPEQPAETALAGDLTMAADLSAYRPALASLLRRP